MSEEKRLTVKRNHEAIEKLIKEIDFLKGLIADYEKRLSKKIEDNERFFDNLDSNITKSLRMYDKDIDKLIKILESFWFIKRRIKKLFGGK